MASKRTLQLYSFSIKRTGANYQIVSRRWCKYPERTKEYAHILDMLHNVEQIESISWSLATPRF